MNLKEQLDSLIDLHSAIIHDIAFNIEEPNYYQSELHLINIKEAETIEREIFILRQEPPPVRIPFKTRQARKKRQNAHNAQSVELQPGCHQGSEKLDQ